MVKQKSKKDTQNKAGRGISLKSGFLLEGWQSPVDCGRVCCEATSREKPLWKVMYYVYVLNSIDGKRMYIGSSANPDERLRAHNSGRVRSTKRYRPWQRMLLEEYSDRNRAEKRERYLKSGWGRAWLKQHISIGGVAESG